MTDVSSSWSSFAAAVFRSLVVVRNSLATLLMPSFTSVPLNELAIAVAGSVLFKIARVALETEFDKSLEDRSLGSSPKSVFKAVFSLDATAPETPAERIWSKSLPCNAAVAALLEASVTIF